MALPDSRSPGTVAQWMVVVVLTAGVALLAGAFLGTGPTASAQTGSSSATPALPLPNGVMAVAGQITRDTYGIYLIDTKNSTMCVYEYLSTDRILQLRAARMCAFDLKLEAYNTSPGLSETRKLVSQASSFKDTTTMP
jgi:acyl-homoserine lactone acylase PvdQ